MVVALLLTSVAAWHEGVDHDGTPGIHDLTFYGSPMVYNNLGGYLGSGGAAASRLMPEIIQLSLAARRGGASPTRAWR